MLAPESEVSRRVAGRLDSREPGDLLTAGEGSCDGVPRSRGQPVRDPHGERPLGQTVASPGLDRAHVALAIQQGQSELFADRMTCAHVIHVAVRQNVL